LLKLLSNFVNRQQTLLKLVQTLANFETLPKPCTNLQQTVNKLLQPSKPMSVNINLLPLRSTPPWWREAGESGTKQLYQPEPSPVTYMVPITRILGRLPLVPVGDHGTIPASMKNRKAQLFKHGRCDEDGRPGSGSKLYFINSWAMCWPTDHPKKPLTG
jgi:hypothetical protein